MSYHDGGHVPEQLQLSTQIDWSLYVHVKEFDCCGRLLCTDSVPLKEFVAKNPMTEKRKIYGNKLGLLDPEKNPVKEEDLFVKDSAKKNAKNLIDGMAEMHGSGVCMVKLDHTNIAVVGGGKLMKYTGLAFVRATLELKQENFEWLKTVLKEDMFEGKPVSHDMDCLFKIMETRAVSSEFLMRNYIAMVPQANKSAFYLRLHEPFKVVKFQNPGRAKLILDSLPHRLTWRQKMRLNHLLEKLFTHGRGYDPADDPWIFALCFKHNCYHKLDRCCDPQTTDQMFDAEEFEDIQESTFPGYVGILEEKMAAELKDAKVDELL